MTNLEFINEQIEECKQAIQQLKIKIDEDKKYPSLIKCHKERIEEFKPVIKRLEQIKTELEAWEVVKKYVKEISVNGIAFEHIINVSHTKQNYELVKKALEVKE